MLWAATHTNSGITDTVTLYSLRTDAPEFKAFESAIPEGDIVVAAPTISLAVWYAINSTCMNPDALQNLILTEPSFFSSSNFPPVPTAPTDPMIMMKLLYTPNLMTSPLCRCLAMTLVTYNQRYPINPSTKAAAQEADKAFKACFSTNGHTPQQRQWFESNFNTDKIFTRKSMSKVSFALIICLSFAFNFIYGSLDFNQENFYSGWPNNLKLASLVLIALVQLFAPLLFNNTAHGSSILTLSSFVIVPAAILQFLFMEFAWAHLKTENRAIHIHPYAFCTTLISLNAIALFETGVFDFGTLLYYMIISHVLSVTYAATLFFTHFQKHESVDVHSLTGYIVLLAAATFLVISGAIPFHPTNGTLNLISLLPWIFTVCVFGFSIFIEHTFQHMKTDTNHTSIKTSNLYYEGYAFLVIIVLGYFMLKLWHVSFGDTILSNAGGVIYRLNYAFFFDMNPKITELYSIP